MRLIVSELTGGLGNQLFQYAAGYAAARRTGAKLVLDLRHYDASPIVNSSLPPRPYGLERFTVSAARMSETEQERADYALRSCAWPRLVRLPGKLMGRGMPVLTDFKQGDDERLHHLRSSAYLVGCWQTENLFGEYRKELLQEFTFKRPPNDRNAALIATMHECTSISLHFRRTDYVDRHPTTLLHPMGMDYYERAMAHMAQAFPDAHYFVFSDDPDWVSANAALPARHTMVTHNAGVDDGEDMRLMSHCDHFIIANSSFSWWGAWLARHREKLVIAPRHWYPNGHGSEADLVPAGWIRL